MDKKKVLGFFVLICIGMLLGFGVSNISAPSSDDSIQQGINYKGYVTVHKNGELVHEGSNTLYETGMEAIEDYLADGSGGGDAFDWIQLCNATDGCGVPQADKSEAFDALVGCGMDAVAGSVGDNGVGNWSVWATFTSTCDDIETNMTRLRNDDDDDLAGLHFPLVSLQESDVLQINWTVSVS